MNSVKRNMELELNIAVKQLVIPIQKHIEQYMQSAEVRIRNLEDIILNQLKKESLILSEDKASKLRHSKLDDAKSMLAKSYEIDVMYPSNVNHKKFYMMETVIDDNNKDKGEGEYKFNNKFLI